MKTTETETLPTTPEGWNAWESEEAIRIIDDGEVRPGATRAAYALAASRRLFAERDALRAELATFKADHLKFSKLTADLVREKLAIKADNERLRAALESVDAWASRNNGYIGGPVMGDVREALGRPDGSNGIARVAARNAMEGR
jgi:hypothetical protein